MGVSGITIFADDLACDIRRSFRDAIGNGLTAEQATSALCKEYESSVEDEEECTVFWLALAATQHKLGHVDKAVIAKALDVIKSGSDLLRWEDEGEKFVAARSNELEKLAKILNSAPPPPRKIPKRHLCTFEFQPGDIFSYRLLSGNSIVARVLDHRHDKGGQYGEINICDWVGSEIPPLEDLIAMPQRYTDEFKAEPLERQREVHPEFDGRMLLYSRNPRDNKHHDRYKFLGKFVPPPRNRRGMHGGQVLFGGWSHFDRYLEASFGLK